MKTFFESANCFVCNYKEQVCHLKGLTSLCQLLHQYHKILAACNIQGERACEFSFNIVQSQYFVVLMQL